MQIYIAQNGQQLGPYTPEQVRAKLLAQKIKLTDMSWHEGIDDWITLSSLQGITLPQQNTTVSEVSTTQNPISLNLSIPVVYAGFWIRFGAWFIDQIALTLLDLVVILIVEDSWTLQIISPLALGVFYYSLMESSRWKATIGKRLFGLAVVTGRGEQLSIGNAFGRSFAKIISAFILGIGFIMAATSQKKQALHDRVADTYVIRTRP